jgi:hypothetical protein
MSPLSRPHGHFGTALLAVALLSTACSTRTNTNTTTGRSTEAVASIDAGTPTDAGTTANCSASATWLTPSFSPLTEVGGDIPVDQETNCQFHQFAYQWFLHLVQPDPNNSNERRFETFRVLQRNKTNQCQQSAMTGKAHLAKNLLVRVPKRDAELGPSDGGSPMILPERIQQATGQALYDQKGNVVLYNVLYQDKECHLTDAGQFQPNTTELKTSWRILTAKDDPSRYYTMQASIEGIRPKPVTLGLVGFHLVINTKKHPEFVWATFEHVDNAPNCTQQPRQPIPDAGWSFASTQCVNTCLPLSDAGCSDAGQSCQFNDANASSNAPDAGQTGTPDEVCRLFVNGTDPGSMTNGNHNKVNLANIDMLNAQLVGPNGFLTQLKPSDPMAVWKNYFLVGSLWTNGGKDANDAQGNATNNQRGSLELANSTMESFAQQFQPTNNNCFMCHNYNSTAPLAVSHIYNPSLVADGGSGGTDGGSGRTGRGK